MKRISKKEKDKKNLYLQTLSSINKNESNSKTYIDSLYNSNSKENININNFPNIMTEIYIPKISQVPTIYKQKEKNFYLALKTLNDENSNNKYILNTSKTSKNLISKISEFSEINPDKSKDYNISKYLHRPITKQIIKIGNQIIKKETCNEYKVYTGYEINKPLVSIYNMKNIFENINKSYIELDSRNISKSNKKIKQKETIEINDRLFNKTKKLKYFHRKNKSSITNYYFNENNSSCSTMNNYNNFNKIKKYGFHYRYKINSLLGIKNQIIFKDRDSTSTLTKEDYNKDNNNHNKNNKDININELNKINNNIFNNENLESIIDFDESKENKIFTTNNKKEKKNNKKINLEEKPYNKIDDNNQIKKEDSNMKTFNKKNNNLSMNKTLRKKYERTEFILRNKIINNPNNFIMKNLINNFEQCEKENKEEKTIDKNNDTFIIKEIDDNFGLNYNIQVSEIQSNSEKNKISHNGSYNSIKSDLILGNYKINEKNSNKVLNKILCKLQSLDSLNIKTINSCPIIGKRKRRNKKNNNLYETPNDSKSKKNIHHFNLDSPFKNNLITNEKNNIKKIYNNDIKSEIIKTNGTNDQPFSVFDYSFYNKLLKAEEIMEKNNKIILKNELLLNTELRLEILLWMMKTCEEFAFKRDTYHNASFYFDMYLSLDKKNINLKDKKELELIGLTCIVISAKLEEIQLPKLKEYLQLLSDKYDTNSLIEMEKKICSKLKWKLIIITKNIWLSWYLCQWDLFIDTIDNIKNRILKYISEENIIYFKKPDDNSYYNFRKITQLIDIMTLDFNSYNYEPKLLIAISFFIILCNHYRLKYNFTKKNFDNNTPLSKLILDSYIKFISQSFDYSFNNKKIQNGIKYFYYYINFKYNFDLPLFYQIYPNKLNGDTYEDFLSYQTTNNAFFNAVKCRINKSKINTQSKSKNKSIKKIKKV